MSRTRQEVRPAAHRVIGRASESLRETSRSVCEQVLADHDEIVATAEELLREVEASGTVQAIRVLFQASEQEVLDAIDAYARKHGLNSRAQVVRVALGKLLKVEVGVPKWGWPKGRARKVAS